jgi:hypothetical protein
VLKQNCQLLAPQQRQLFPSGPDVPGLILKHSRMGSHSPQVQSS